MEYVFSAVTDVGISKKVNQDGLYASVLRTPNGKVMLAVMCDGMGGLAQGEVASSVLVNSFENWFNCNISIWTDKSAKDKFIVEQWKEVVNKANDKILTYGQNNNFRLGTTITALLITDSRYYLMNIGDTRAYVLKDGLNQLSVDHTLIEHQVRLGNMTREQADNSSIRNIITRCVGVNSEVYPDFFFGAAKKDAVYLLCTDGFRHEISEDEIMQKLSLEKCQSQEDIHDRLNELVELNKQRKEKDNISVLAIATKDDEESTEPVDNGDDDVTVQLFELEDTIKFIHSDINL